MGKKSRFLFIVILGVIFTLCSPLSNTFAKSGGKSISLRMQFSFPPEDFGSKLAVGPLLDDIEKACNGRVKFKRFPAGALVSTEKMLSAIRSGAIDFAPLPLPMYGDIPDGLAFLEALPYVWRSAEDFYNIYYKHGMVELWREVFAKDFNAYYAGPMLGGPFGFMTSKPVRKLEDFKGKKIWGPGQDLFFSSIKASAAFVPVPEMYMALQMGTLDGIIFSYPELESLKFKEVAPYVIKPFMLEVMPVGYLMNMNTWKALPPDIQKIFNQQVKDWVMPGYRAQMEATEKVLASPDVTVIELPANDAAYIRNFAETKVWDELLSKGPLGKKALNILKDYYDIK
jgi:TRAP-type C4-dicarboxylate transport system substrate-binding protein